MKPEQDILHQKLKAYKKKYYLNKAVRGIILLIATTLTSYLILNSVEFGLHSSPIFRGIMFFSFIILFLILSTLWLFIPIAQLYNSKKQISDEEAAKQIGALFPELKDKLLNTIQLEKFSGKQNGLISASIEKRTTEFSIFSFSNAIKISANKKYLKYAAYPSALLVIILLFIPQFLTESTHRIINFDKEFFASSLFSISISDQHLSGFKNENITVKMQVDGEAIPLNFYLNSNGRRVKMESVEDATFQYTFQKVQSNFDFHIEAFDFKSEKFQIEVHTRPDIKNFNVELNYPRYTKKTDEVLNNTGNLLIPEGTTVKWLMKTISSDSSQISFSPDFQRISLESTDNQIFTYKNRYFKSLDYQIHLFNTYSENKDKIQYHIEVIKDRFPTISLNANYQDTTLFSFLVLGGTISDDYGIKKLNLNYKITSGNQVKQESSIEIPTSKNLKSQNYFYQWFLDSLQLKEGHKLEYFIQVWDNDAVNGSKPAQTGTYHFNIPTTSEVKENISKQAESAKNKLDESINQAKELKEQIQDIQEKLKSKKELDWQDKKQLNELLKQKEKLEEELKKLSEQNKSLTEKRERFSKQDEKLQEKANQLQKLMDEVLDEETKKLYEELKKLLEEQKNLDEVQDLMDQIENKEDNIEKEIERALELFKRLQFDYKMEDIVNELEDLSLEQEDLSKDTQDKSNDLEDLSEQQDKLNETFEEIKEDIKELNELNEELKDPESLDETSEDEDEISQDQQDSNDQLKQKKRKKASQSQKKASDKMKKLQKKMEQMQAGMEMEMLQENLDNLRDIIDNLVKVSFDQENIMQEFEGVNQSDPRYVTLSQRQLKLRDDSKIIEDSLTALAGRVFQIASFITRELDGMNDNIEASLQALKDRKRTEAVSNQQFAMTSINNLALLLDDVLQQMQQQMADAMGKPQKGKIGKKQSMPGLSELQKQLNEQINDLKKSGKSGRKLSEELAKMAAQQEMIRQQLQEMQELLDEEGKKPGGSGLNDVIKKMEETEMDLVKKQITRETLNRQQDILTKLLKAEDAMRERELDNKREADKAKNVIRKIPPAYEEYLKAKEQEVELLKTIPLKLNPYYKEEVNKYFQRLSEQ